MFSGSRPDIHNIIRRPHRILIMLHNKNRISQIPQVKQSRKQLVIVPLVKTNTWLIQNIGNSHQTGANLSCQTDSLSLSAGKGSCGSRQ